MTVGINPGQLLITGGSPEPEPLDIPEPTLLFIGMRRSVSFIGIKRESPDPDPELIVPYTTVFVLAA